MILDVAVAEGFLELQFLPVIFVDYGAFVVVFLGNQLGPVAEPVRPASSKVDTFVLRAVDVAGPKNADSVVFERVLRRPAGEGHVDAVRRDKVGSRATFEMIIGRRRLVQFGCGIADPPLAHGGISRLKADILVLDISAVKNVFEIHAGDSGGEDTSGARPMLKTPDAVVTGAMFFVGVVVPNGCGEDTDEGIGPSPVKVVLPQI